MDSLLFARTKLSCVCVQIFIPMHEEALVNHWWLLVVNLIDRTGEIFDSAPNPRMSPRREADARTVVRLIKLVAIQLIFYLLN